MGLARAVLLYTYSLLQGEDMEGALSARWFPSPSADIAKSQ